MHHIVEQFMNGCGRHMNSCVGRCVINKYRTIFPGYPSIAENHIRYIPDPFFPFGCHKVTGRFINHFGNIMQVSHEHVEHIAQTSGRITYTVSQMQPTMFRFDGGRAQAILHFIHRMIDFGVNYFFLIDHGSFHTIAYAKPDATTLARFNKFILGAGIKCITSIVKFGVQDHIALLGGLGFTTELIEECDLKIGRYEEAVTDPRQAIINRAVHTENLDKYIKEALGICYVLDDMMVLFKGVALGEVYKKYVMAREIIDLGEAGDGTDGGVEAVINLLFTNGITTVPLVGVEVGLGGSDVRGVTDEAGRVRFSVGPSRYNVVIEAEGFARGNFPVDVPIAGVYSFKFQLRPVG